MSNTTTTEMTSKITYISNGSVTSVKGIKASGIHCGLKKKKKYLDLIYSEV